MKKKVQIGIKIVLTAQLSLLHFKHCEQEENNKNEPFLLFTTVLGPVIIQA